jgi:hypothetical protein
MVMTVVAMAMIMIVAVHQEQAKFSASYTKCSRQDLTQDPDLKKYFFLNQKTIYL